MPGGKKGNKGHGGGNQGGGGKKPSDQPKTEGGEAQFKFNFAAQGTDGKKSDFAAQAAGLVPIIQKQLNTLVGASSGYFESLPLPVQNRIRALKKLHAKKADLDKQYKKELLALQSKFDALIDPLYERRKELVTGATEPTVEEAAEEPKPEKKEETKEENKEEKKAEEKNEEEEVAEDVKGIPNFWLEAFKHHSDFTESISKNDEKALKYLVDVRWKPLPPAEGRSDASFVLEFEFNENPYFTNKILSKTYYLTEHEQLGETMFDKMEGTDIDWNPGKNITVKLVQVQTGGGRRGGRRGGKGKGKSGGGKTVTVEEPCESFFNFFKSDVASAFGISEEEDMQEEDLQDLYEADYEMGITVKEQIIPSAVLWFTGEIEDPYAGLGEEEGFDDDEEGEYDSAEDPDFEVDPNAPAQQKPECAQQ